MLQSIMIILNKISLTLVSYKELQSSSCLLSTPQSILLYFCVENLSWGRDTEEDINESWRAASGIPPQIHVYAVQHRLVYNRSDEVF